MTLLFIVFLLLQITAFLVARKVYIVLKSRENRYALLISTISFLIVCMLLGAIFLSIVLHNMDFGR